MKEYSCFGYGKVTINSGVSADPMVCDYQTPYYALESAEGNVENYKAGNDNDTSRV